MIEYPERPASQTGAADETNTAQEKRDLIRLRFDYEVLDNDISIKEKEIEKIVDSMTAMQQDYDQKVDRLNNQLNRYNRSQTYGKLQEQRILADIKALQMDLRNKNFIARDRIKALRAELTLLKQDRNDLEKRIQELNRANR